MASFTRFKHPQYRRILEKHVARGLETAAFSFQKRLRLMLSKTGTGKKYPGSSYTSALAGNPPAVQTGMLRNSFVTGKSVSAVKKNATGSTVSVSQASINASIKYAGPLEKTHPFFDPTIKQMAKERVLDQIMDDRLEDAVKEANKVM